MKSLATQLQEDNIQELPMRGNPYKGYDKDRHKSAWMQIILYHLYLILYVTFKICNAGELSVTQFLHL